MTKIVVSMLILFSSAASIYYSINGLMNPESALVYNKAHMSRADIQLLSLLLGLGGVLILLPQTFRIGGVFLFAHSLITIGCFVATRDWKGGLLEFAFLQIPIVMVVVGYPSSVLAKIKNLIA
ncbi:MAG: hypothetical protein WDO69_01205 [Pseudomonadota bacterium]